MHTSIPNDRYQDRPLVPAFDEGGADLLALAHQRFPGGTPITIEGDGRQAVADTSRLLTEGHTLLYGACFAHEGILAIIDVLVKQQGRWYAYLLRPSTRVKEWHLVDAALHEQVLAASGLPQVEVCVLLLNMEYVRRGPLSPHDLFIEKRVSRRLPAFYGQTHGRKQMLRRMAAKKAKQQVRAVEAPGALFPSVDMLSAAPVPVPATPLEVDKEQLRAFLERLQYPLYFMDFEAYQVAVPEYDGHWPFRQLPFQFSVHRLDAPDAPLHQQAFIAPVDAEPIEAFGAALLQATGHEGTVLVYNIDSEKLMIEQLRRDHPQWNDQLDALITRLVDLMLPFSKQIIRIPDIGNKLSLKYVLPALVPDMSYTALAIGSGEDAHQAYNDMRTSKDPAFVEATCAALLAYCEVDTLALVRILERMRMLAE